MTIPLTVRHQNEDDDAKLPTLELDMDKDADLEWADAAGHRSSLIGPIPRPRGYVPSLQFDWISLGLESVHHTTTITASDIPRRRIEHQPTNLRSHKADPGQHWSGSR